MRAFTIVLVTLAAAGIGFFAGRATVPDPTPEIVVPVQPGTAGPPGLRLSSPDPKSDTDPRADLLRALRQPAEVRDEAVRRAMNAWLIADGARAIAVARDHPRFSKVAERMTRLALFAYPELFVDDPSLLEAVPNAESLIIGEIASIMEFDPGTARALVKRHVSDPWVAGPMLRTIDHFAPDSAPQLTMEDAQAELESILAERKRMERFPRLHTLIDRVASQDPAAAAELIDEMPGSDSRMAIRSLMQVWARTDPEAAARWLADKGGQIAQDGLSQLALQWGKKDLEAASAYADTLTGARRAVYLAGLANSVSRLSTTRMQTWMSRYEQDDAYPDLVGSIAGNFVQRDVETALSLVEGLPEGQRLAAYASVIPMITWDDPEAAIALVEEADNETLQAGLSSMVFATLAQIDAEFLLARASRFRHGPVRDRAFASIASAMASVDVDGAIDAIDEIDDRELRVEPASVLVMTAETEAEAVRLGRRYGLDRDRVLELRSPSGGFRPGVMGFGLDPAILGIVGARARRTE